MKALFVIMMTIFTATVALAAGTAEDLVRTMTDRTAAWEARCKAEDTLTHLPPQDVLPILLPDIGKGMPSPAIWNSGGRELDKMAPVEWQIFYAVARSWIHQVDSLPRDSGGSLLLRLLGQATAVNARIRIVTDLTRRWVPEAEAPVAALLKTRDENLTVRTTAALALILHGTNDYHNLLLEYARTSGFAEQKRWFDLLSDPRHKNRSGVDPRVTKMGFNLILKERELSPAYVHGAYFLAIKTGEYIGQEFKPDRTKPEYQGKHGLTDKYFADTVQNALDWWSTNKERIEKELPARQTQLVR